MLENLLNRTNLEKLLYEIEQSKKFITEVKKNIGAPFNMLEYYGIKNFSRIENASNKLEKHHFFDEVYFVKMVGLLESLHIHLFSDYIIYNDTFKKYIFEKFEVLSTKGHMTGRRFSNAFTGEESVRFSSDRGLTDYVATRFFPGQISAGCLNATSLLSERTLNKKVYDKIIKENFRTQYLTNHFEEINQLFINKENKPLSFFTEINDFVNLSEIISELRNRIVHRNFGYDFSSIISVKNEKFTNFKKKEFFDSDNYLSLEDMYPEASTEEIKIMKEKFYDDDDLDINEDLVEYLKQKKLLNDAANPKYFDCTDNNILQFISYRMDEIVSEFLFVHQCLYDKFIVELE